jgi:hypothetical protein
MPLHPSQHPAESGLSLRRRFSRICREWSEGYVLPAGRQSWAIVKGGYCIGPAVSGTKHWRASLLGASLDPVAPTHRQGLTIINRQRGPNRVNTANRFHTVASCQKSSHPCRALYDIVVSIPRCYCTRSPIWEK